MSNLTPGDLNVTLDGGCVADILEHASGGSHPLLIWLHGGGGSTGDHYRIWVNGNTQNRFATYLHGSSLSNFDIASLGVPQHSNTGPTSAGHLATMVDADLGVIWPDALPRCIAGINDLIATVNPPGVVLAGFSYGTVMAVCAMLSTNLVGVDGFLGYYTIPDLRRVGPSQNVGSDEHITCSREKDLVHWSQIKGIGGQATEQDWINIQPHIKKTATIRWYIERGMTSNYREMFLVNAQNLGNHKPPYGDGSPLTNVHDSDQHTSLTNALTAASLPFEEYRETTSGAWESSGEGDTMNTTVESWMVEKVT